MAHGFLPDVPFFLLALPDKFYIWKDSDNILPDTEPTYEIDARPLLKAYYEKGETSPEKITEQGLELALTSWFNELAQLGIPDDIPLTEKDQLVNSGIATVLREGHVEYHVGS